MFELAVILVLVLLNGLLAGAEMAVVTARSGRLQALAEAGNRGARAALRLREDPEEFLASVQVGITMVGAIAGAFGGSVFAARLTPWFERLGAGAAAPEIAFMLVVIVITYLSVVFGELVPKSLALRLGERAAVLTARPMLLLARVAKPAVWLLTGTSNLVLRGFGDRTNFLEVRLTRDDLEAMFHEAKSGGAVDVPTVNLLSRALEFTELRVADVVVHRSDVVAIERNATPDQMRELLLGNTHRRIPVFQQTIDDVVGYLLRDDVLAALWRGEPLDIDRLLREPLFVPEQMRAESALRELQERKLALAIAMDESGGVAGIVTVEDLVEELVGEIFDEVDRPQPRRLVQEGPGVWRALGSLDLRDLQREIGMTVPGFVTARTVGGLCVELAGNSIPPEGAAFEFGHGTRLEVIKATQRRVREVRIRRLERTPQEGVRSRASGDLP